MYTTEELIEAITREFPSVAIKAVPKSSYFDINDFPIEGLTIRIKPNSFGIFQVKFPLTNAQDYVKMNKYKELDSYFKSSLRNNEATFICQIESNQIIYVYPKYVNDLECCIRVLVSVIQQVKSSQSIINKQITKAAPLFHQDLPTEPLKTPSNRTPKLPMSKTRILVILICLSAFSLAIINEIRSNKRRKRSDGL